MIAGASWTWWLGFHAVVATLLMADFLLIGRRRETRHPHAFAWLWTAVLALISIGFAVWIALTQGRQTALEWVGGYAIETSLSVDNLFVFMVVFQGFQIDRPRQHKALLWGVWGAFALRAAFIAAGVTLLRRFDWVTWFFGLFLLYAAWRVMRLGSAHAATAESEQVYPDARPSSGFFIEKKPPCTPSKWALLLGFRSIPAWTSSWLARLKPAQRGLRPEIRSLVPVILAVEAADLLFAADSIPAVLSVTHNPFVAYTSNVAAILALRSLYFALAAMLDRFRYLHYGLGAILAFAALKMLAARWIAVPVTLSLAVIGAILAVCAVGTAAGQRVSKSAS
jgi:tellurite resistance protein TerC